MVASPVQHCHVISTTLTFFLVITVISIWKFAHSKVVTRHDLPGPFWGWRLQKVKFRVLHVHVEVSNVGTWSINKDHSRFTFICSSRSGLESETCNLRSFKFSTFRYESRFSKLTGSHPLVHVLILVVWQFVTAHWPKDLIVFQLDKLLFVFRPNIGQLG